MTEADTIDPAQLDAQRAQMPPITKGDIDRARLALEQGIARQARRSELETLAKRLQAVRILRDRQKARESLLYFIGLVRPDLKIGKHHRAMAALSDRMDRGEVKMSVISMPPGHTKSEFWSICKPAHFIGKNPDKRILHVSHTVDLVEDFSRQIRDLISSAAYKRLFPGVGFRRDSDSVRRWSTNQGGKYVMAGVGGRIAGKRGELGIIDDPISEQDAWSDTKRETVLRWYPGGYRSRLMPGAQSVLVMTRWHHQDLAGHVIDQAVEHGDVLVNLKLPAILDQRAAEFLDAVEGDALFPELWPLEELLALKRGMPAYQWSALYQQEPTSEDGDILPRSAWRCWERIDRKGKKLPLPDVELVVSYYDTAYEDNTEADYSARTTWGVFWDEEREAYSVLLLEAWRRRLTFPDLLTEAVNNFKEYEQDLILVEPKATGKPLVKMVRRNKANAPVREAKPMKSSNGRELDKKARAHITSTLLHGGGVWVPSRRDQGGNLVPLSWAQEVIDECAQFPKGAHDDYVDTCTGSWNWLLSGYRANVPGDLPNDHEEPDDGELMDTDAKYANPYG